MDLKVIKWVCSKHKISWLMDKIKCKLQGLLVQVLSKLKEKEGSLCKIISQILEELKEMPMDHHILWSPKKKWYLNSNSKGRASECKHLLNFNSKISNNKLIKIKEPWSECRVIKSKCNFNNFKIQIRDHLKFNNKRVLSISCRMLLKRR